MRRVVVVGGSLAGHGVVEALHALGFGGHIIVIGDEKHLPYDRWPLSEGYLVGTTDRSGLDIPMSGCTGADWQLGTRAVGLDLAGRHVLLGNGDAIGFDGLVVATGARARELSATSGVRGAFTLRTVEDADAIREALSQGQRDVVVIGGGLIGAEMASAAVALGHRVSLITPDRSPAVRQLGRLVSEHVDRVRLAAGVRVVRRSRARGVGRRRGGDAAGVLLGDGRWIPADIVVVAIGTVPNVEWLRGSGLDIRNGLLCAPTLHALESDVVVGAGDVARFPHPLVEGQSVRLEHWASTRDLATLAAGSLLAGPALAERLQSLPQFGTVLHGIDVRVVGFPDVAEQDQLVRGSFASGSFVVCLSRRGKKVAAISVNGAASPEALAELVDGVPSRA